MTVSIGSFTFPYDSEPDDGAVSSIAQHNWIKVNGIGFRGSIKQYTHTDSREHPLHAGLVTADRDELQAIYDGQAQGGGPVTFIDTDAGEPFVTGVPVIITRFTAELNSSVRGLPWWDCWITLDEDVT
jgi:hypothetical protein